MALVITNRYQLSSILLLFTFFLGSCKVKYFNYDIKNDIKNISDSDIQSYLPVGFLDHIDIYSLEMNSTYFYKNNVRENILMTEYSRHLSRVLFFENDDAQMPDKFQRFEVWLTRRSPTDSSLVKGEKAVMVSYKGKKIVDGKEEYELVKVFFGSLHEKNVINYHKKTIITFSPEYLLLYTGSNTKCATKKCKKKEGKLSSNSKETNSADATFCNENYHKIIREKIKKQGKTSLNIEAIIELKKVTPKGMDKKFDIIQFEAIINNNYSQFAAEKSMIFDLTQIYGEPVWLLKKPK